MEPKQPGITDILIAEASKTQALKLQHFLESNGFKVTTAHDGKDALDKLTRNKAKMCISDIMMPEMDGYELCLEIKSNETLRDIAVILLTSMSDPLDVLRCLECGADSYSVKPFGGKELLSRVNQILEEKETLKKSSGGTNIL
jgi:DNA-binding response OmpR family regulator